MLKSDIVIIGAGHAGGMASIFLRKLKYKGKITIVGDEKYLPYQRPELSKGFLYGNIDESRLFLKKDDFYKKNNIDVILNNSVVSIDKEKKELVLENQRKIEYKTLILATGSSVNKLNLQKNNDVPLYLRDFDDSKYLRRKLNQSNDIGIIGSGYIGLEVAAIANKLGKNVTIFEIENRVMSRTVSEEVADFYRKKHEAAGVSFIFNSQVSAIKKEAKTKVILNNKDTMEVDLLAVGIGVKPNISIALDAKLVCNDGIVVDQNCITSDESIFAIGDCTKHPNEIYQNNIRLESVHNAVEQAKTSASYIIGKAKPYTQIPWFWTEQYNLKLQIAGIIDKNAEYFFKGSLEKESFSILCVRDEKLIAIESVNNPSDFVIGKKLIESKKKIKTKLISKKNFNMKNLI